MNIAPVKNCGIIVKLIFIGKFIFIHTYVRKKAKAENGVAMHLTQKNRKEMLE